MGSINTPHYLYEGLTNISQMKKYEILFKEMQYANSFHVVNSKYVFTQLKNNEIIPNTTHRYWKDGRKYMDDGSDIYKSSYWYVGISTTRDTEFARVFGGNKRSIIYELDIEKIKQNYKVIPIDWGSSIINRNLNNARKEAEEFIICNKYEKSLYNKKTKKYDISKIENFIKTSPRLKLDRYLVSIYFPSIEAIDYVLDHNKELYNLIINHPKYAGIL